MTSPSLRDQVRNSLQCGVCLELLCRPYTLQCQHSFCGRSCIRSIKQEATTSESRFDTTAYITMCPLCRRRSLIPEQQNPTLADLCERVRTSADRKRAKQDDREAKSAQLLTKELRALRANATEIFEERFAMQRVFEDRPSLSTYTNRAPSVLSWRDSAYGTTIGLLIWFSFTLLCYTTSWDPLVFGLVVGTFVVCGTFFIMLLTRLISTFNNDRNDIRPPFRPWGPL